MKNGLISVIIPVHNSTSTLERCVESIVNQTYENIELILVNNGSKDNSLELCYKLANKDKRIVVINLEEGNVSKARNAALDVMQGEYFAFVDSDDYIDLTMYEKLYNKAREGGADLVFCKFADIVKGQIVNRNEEHLHDLVYNGQIKYWFLNSKDYVRRSACRSLFRRESLGSVRFNADLYSGEDSVYMFDAYSNSDKMDLVDENLYYCLISDTVYSKKYFSERYAENNKIYAQKSRDFLSRAGLNDFAAAVQFNEWTKTVHAALAYSLDYKKDIKLIINDEYWQSVKNNQYNYRTYLKILCGGFKWRVRAFLLKRGMFGLYRLLVKIMLKG